MKYTSKTTCTSFQFVRNYSSNNTVVMTVQLSNRIMIYIYELLTINIYNYHLYSSHITLMTIKYFQKIVIIGQIITFNQNLFVNSSYGNKAYIYRQVLSVFCSIINKVHTVLYKCTGPFNVLKRNITNEPWFIF